MKKLFFSCLIIFTSALYSQNEFIPLNIQKAFEKGTRSKDGKPGENYWQNSADYNIKIKFDPYEKTIDGSEAIKYFNNSPDSLDQLVIRLYQNFIKATVQEIFKSLLNQ